MVLMGLGCWAVETHESVRNSKKMDENEGGLVLSHPIVVFLCQKQASRHSGFAFVLASMLIWFLAFITESRNSLGTTIVYCQCEEK